MQVGDIDSLSKYNLMNVYRLQKDEIHILQKNLKQF